MPHLISSFFYSFFSPSSSTLWSPLSFFPVPCPFIIAPSLPLVSRLAGSRWWGREGGRDVGEDGWREGWKTGGGDVLSSVPMFIPSQRRPTSWNCLWMFLLLCHSYYLQICSYFNFIRRVLHRLMFDNVLNLKFKWLIVQVSDFRVSGCSNVQVKAAASVSGLTSDLQEK